MKAMNSFVLVIIGVCVVASSMTDEQKRIKTIIDTDGVADDVAAILMLTSKRNTKYDILQITTSDGTTNVKDATRNVLLALNITKQLGKIPVYVGSSSPILPGIPTDYYYGIDGLGDNGIERPPLTAASDGSAVDKIIEVVKNNPGEITVVALGPFTNLALAVKRYPNLIDEIDRIFYLGACEFLQIAEFNTRFDPTAATIVLNKIRYGRAFVLESHNELSDTIPKSEWYQLLSEHQSDQFKLLNKALQKTLASPQPKFDLVDSDMASILLNSDKNRFPDVQLRTCSVLQTNLSSINVISFQKVDILSKFNVSVYKKKLIEYLQ